MRDIWLIYSMLALLFLAMLMALPAVADQHYWVDDNGSNSHSGSSAMDAWKTITHALNNTTGGSGNRIIIHVAPGNYDITMGGGDHETFPLEPKDHDTIEGAGASGTVVDAAGSGQSVFRFIDANAEVKMSGLTITNGDRTTGGGIVCVDSRPEVSDCVIEYNEASYGAGIYLEESPATILRCTIQHNSDAINGGGIYIYDNCDPTIRDCTISWNQADNAGSSTKGGGISCRMDCSPTIDNCVIEHNSAKNGAGIHVWESCAPVISGCVIGSNVGETAGGGIMFYLYTPSEARVEHCIISGNTVGEPSTLYGGGGGIACDEQCDPAIFNCLILNNEYNGTSDDRYAGGISATRTSDPVITNCTIEGNIGGGVSGWSGTNSRPFVGNCIVWNNGDDLYGIGGAPYLRYSDIEDGDDEGENGNISQDPLWIDVDGGDYHLSHTDAGQATNSPCINRGEEFACECGLHLYTTRTDEEYDSRRVDMGYHYASSKHIYWVSMDAGRDDLYDGRSDVFESGTTGPWKTISHALAEAPAGTSADPVEIRVLEGTYDSGIEGSFPLEITSYRRLIAWYGSAETTIDAHLEGQERSAIAIDNQTSIIIRGFTITGGYDTDGYGGGISCSESENLSIENCDVHGNTAEYGGGLSFISCSQNVVTCCTISCNVAGVHGGGVYCEDYSSLDLSHVVMQENTAGDAGGALYCTSYSSPRLFNCLVTGNAAEGEDGYGGGINLVTDADARMTNCTIEGNTPSGVTASWASDPVINNCILWNNGNDLNGDSVDCSKVTYCDIENGQCSGEETNMSEDPKFVPRDPDNPEDEYTGHYLAQQDAQAGDSPCLNKGQYQASAYGLHIFTTCTDGRYDEGLVDMGYHYPGHYTGDDDTYIELASFEATARGSSIVITWETGTEIDNAGFNLFRIESGGRTTARKINERLIPAQGSLSGGASYEFLDANVRPGINYDYYLVDIDTSGKETVHGPVSARLLKRLPALLEERTNPYIR